MIKDLGGAVPHESYGSWEEFLKECNVQSRCKGVTHYRYSNCSYIVFPDETMVRTYGYHGDNLMHAVMETAPDIVLEGIKKRRGMIKLLLQEMQDAWDTGV